jgi:hypothetical protein
MLFKYLSEARVQILESLEIRFTQPRALNDPFEASPLIDIIPEKKSFIEKMERNAKDVWNNTINDEKTPENYKILQNTINELRATALEKMSPSNVGISVMDLINPTLGVLSLSRTFSNLLMWSHYAESHKGFVIGLDTSHNFFYQKTHEGLKSAPNIVSYTTQRSTTHAGDPDFYAKMFCEKPIDWAYEEEVRIFRLFAQDSKQAGIDKYGHPIYLVSLPKECIKSIYIGAHAKSSLKESILKYTTDKKLTVSVFEMSMSKSRYELEYQQCV